MTEEHAPNETTPPEKPGSLVVVGTGIRTVGHLTLDAIAWMKAADKVLYVVGDPVAEGVIKELNPAGAESLTGMYAEGKPRIETYEEMIGRILDCVRGGLVTCLACYGHPGVFVYPSHEAIRRARTEGYAAQMLPGVSSEDCLFADLGIDPGIYGCQSFEATDFLANRRIVDPRSSLVLWQIGVLGDAAYKTNGYDTSAMPVLVERLREMYPPGHVVYLYEASVFIGCAPRIVPATIEQLPTIPMSAGFTMYIPPAYATFSDPTTCMRMAQFTGAAAAR